MRKDKREILAEVLSGSLSMAKALPALIDSIKDENPVISAFLEDDGRYYLKFPEKEGSLSEEEFKQMTKFNHTIVIKILRDPSRPPIANRESDVVL